MNNYPKALHMFVENLSKTNMNEKNLELTTDENDKLSTEQTKYENLNTNRITIEPTTSEDLDEKTKISKRTYQLSDYFNKINGDMLEKITSKKSLTNKIYFFKQLEKFNTDSLDDEQIENENFNTEKINDEQIESEKTNTVTEEYQNLDQLNITTIEETSSEKEITDKPSIFNLLRDESLNKDEQLEVNNATKYLFTELKSVESTDSETFIIKLNETNKLFDNTNYSISNDKINDDTLVSEFYFNTSNDTDFTFNSDIEQENNSTLYSDIEQDSNFTFYSNITHDTNVKNYKSNFLNLENITTDTISTNTSNNSVFLIYSILPIFFLVVSISLFLYEKVKRSNYYTVEYHHEDMENQICLDSKYEKTDELNLKK